MEQRCEFIKLRHSLSYIKICGNIYINTDLQYELCAMRCGALQMKRAGGSCGITVGLIKQDYWSSHMTSLFLSVRLSPLHKYDVTRGDM